MSRITVHVCKDDDAGVYFATSDDIGLAVESDSLDALMTEIDSALSGLLQVKEENCGMVK
jgi:hypothetical protein